MLLSQALRGLLFYMSRTLEMTCAGGAILEGQLVWNMHSMRMG